MEDADERSDRGLGPPQCNPRIAALMVDYSDAAKAGYKSQNGII
jgi:hypothetical protein